MTKLVPILSIMGPTASGKTQLACQLAQYLPISIISVDSAMVYTGLDIGTAKPSIVIRKQIPHYLIDICEPTQIYSVAKFCTQVHSLLPRIIAAGRIPVLVGGTMLYFNALQHGLSKLPAADAKIRMRLYRQAQYYGWDILHAYLATLDPDAAKRIHPHDKQRIQRALEVYYTSGIGISQLQQCSNNKTTMSSSPRIADCQGILKVQYHSPYKYDYINIALLPDRQSHACNTIVKRTDDMLYCGFVAEVSALYARHHSLADSVISKLVGYKQVWQYLQGEYGYNTMRDKIIIATRQLAKRQFTWLRRYPLNYTFNPQIEDAKLRFMYWLSHCLQQYDVCKGFN